MAKSHKQSPSNKLRAELTQTVHEGDSHLSPTPIGEEIMETPTIDDSDVSRGISKNTSDNRSREKNTGTDNTQADTVEHAPIIPGALLFDTTHSAQGNTTHSPERRYDIGTILGSGGSGSVYDLTDNNLKRTVAAKFLSPKMSRKEKTVKKFVREALLTSHLEHPNIPPIYDLDTGENKQIYYTMKKIKGVSLAALTQDTHTDNDIDSLKFFQKKIIHKTDTIHELTSIFIKTSESIAYAHSRGIIHRDIKPDNIMIGEYGEVYIVDWGIAFDTKDKNSHVGKMSGTPLYMSPEQSRRETIDERSDIYCLGTCFFHILFKCPPFSASSVESFWEQKKEGRYHTLDPITRNSIPAPLAAICFKCIMPDANDRYPDANSLVIDLKKYQSGALVDAYKYNVIDTFKHHLKKSIRHVVWGLLFLLTFSIVFFFVFQYYQRQVAGWGDPIYVQNFDDDDNVENSQVEDSNDGDSSNENSNTNWKKDWVFNDDESKFVVTDQRLTPRNGPEFMCFYKHRITGGVAIEFEGEMLPGSKPGDLTIVYSPDITNLENAYPKELYDLQLGGLDNSCASINGPTGRLDYRPLQLKRGVRYKIRGELDGTYVRLFLNGTLICSYELLFPIESGYIGLYAFYDNKGFDNIKIYNKELPQITSITTTGDLLFENQEYLLASERYKKISETYKETDNGDESLYKLGLCYYKMNHTAKAMHIWSKIDRPEYNNQINYYRWKELYADEQYDVLLAHMSTEYSKNNKSEQIRQNWSVYLKDAVTTGKLLLIDTLLAFRNQHFPDDQVFSQVVFNALRVKGKPSRALVLFPKQEHIAIQALEEAGQYKDIMANYPLQKSATVRALYFSGHYTQIIEEHSDLHPSVLSSMIASGRLKDAERSYGQEEKYQRQILINSRGGLQKIIHNYPKDSNTWAVAQLYSGNESAFLEVIHNNGSSQIILEFDARMALELKKFKTHVHSTHNTQNAQDEKDLSAIKKMIHNAAGQHYYRAHSAFALYFLYPLLKFHEGDSSILKKDMALLQSQRKETQGMRLWYCSHLLLGDIGKKEFFNQPKKSFIEHDYTLFKALQLDLKGRTSEALTYFHTFKELPPYKRHWNATISRFVNMRIAALQDALQEAQKPQK